MKKALTIFAAAVAFCIGAKAQDIIVPEGYEMVDSLVYTPVSSIDRSLDGKSILQVLPEGINVSQSQDLRKALEDHVEANRTKQYSGYRIRIYFDNKQDSRYESESEMNRFKAKYHGMQAYRSYTNPFFKVTVGDFRTKFEAQEMLKVIQLDFPAAFVVREKFKYPAMDASSYQVDTVRFIRQIAE